MDLVSNQHTGGNIERFLVATSDPKTIVGVPNRNCRVTEYSKATEMAHLVTGTCLS
ncbi:hypothetical protein GGR58DRAFT_490744 [Xylaria digitata]|nr:hypothetical protein GGR58DRAFT_490744 [Xylaria digitata]